MSTKLSETEQHTWQYIQEHIEQIPSLSITRLSEQANVSTATIVRTLQKLKYSGYNAFKNQTILEQQNNPQFAILNHANESIKNVILKNEREMDNTLKNLDLPTIQAAIYEIAKAKRIYIFARGFSELIAKEMLVKFQLLDLNCDMHDDPNIIRPISQRLQPDSLAIFITLNGETPELVTAAKNVKQNHVQTITFTTNAAGSIVPFSDLLFVGYKSQVSMFPDYEVRSRLPLQIMTRILTDALAIELHH